MPETMQYSDAVPHGSAGIANQGRPSTAEQVGAEYGEAMQQAVTSAMDKRADDWATLMSGRADAPVSDSGGYA